MATINYENKEAVSEFPSIPAKNKFTDDDANLIKTVGNQILTTLGVYTDDWSSSATYLVDDVVVYDNRYFKNLTGTNTATTPDEDTTNWLEVSIRDISGGAEIPIQHTAPANPRDDDLWIDTSDNAISGANIFNEYSASNKDVYSCDYSNKYFGGVELYSGTTAGNITLNESAANYSAIEIFYKSSDGVYGNTGKIYSPNNKNIGLFAPYNISTTCYNKYAIATINGTAISIGNQIETQLWTSIQINTGNYFTIEKVIGYK